MEVSHPKIKPKHITDLYSHPKLINTKEFKDNQIYNGFGFLGTTSSKHKKTNSNFFITLSNTKIEQI